MNLLKYFLKFRFLRKTFAVLLVLICIVAINSSILNPRFSNIKPNIHILYTKDVVENKSDLLEIEISKLLQYQKWDKLGISDSLKDMKFEVKEFKGFLSNLNMKSLLDGKNDLKSDGAPFDKKISKTDYANLVKCSDLEYKNSLEFFISPYKFEIDFKTFRKQLINSNSQNAGEYKIPDEDGMEEKDIIAKRWFAFGTAAVWLETENCYVAYTRLLYAGKRDKISPHASAIIGQAFDKNWNELQDKRIYFRDVNIPMEIEKEIKRLKSQLDKGSCAEIKQNKLEYELCIADVNNKTAKIKGQIDEILGKYSIKYPTVLDIPYVKNSEDLMGPEDPHVILKKDYQGEEPVIIFNMDTLKGRRVHAFMPHRKHDNLIDFDIDNTKLRKHEKNWTPFFYPGIEESSNAAVGVIHFIYDFNPLEIIRCSLLTGHCSYVFEASTVNMKREGSSIFRGGTQFVPLPDVLPQVKGKNMWLGFPKSHASDCGCGKAMYRPNLSLLVEQDGVFHLDFITPNVDFNEEVLSWNLKDSSCEGFNVLSPSSISNWFVVSQDPETLLYEDYLELTISEADAISKRVTIRGVLNYVLGIFNNNRIKETFEINDQSSAIITKTKECASDEVVRECEAYGKKHSK